MSGSWKLGAERLHDAGGADLEQDLALAGGGVHLRLEPPAGVDLDRGGFTLTVRLLALSRFEQIAIDDLPEKIRAYRSDRFVVAADETTDIVPMDELEQHVRWVASDAGLDVSEAAIVAAKAGTVPKTKVVEQGTTKAANVGDTLDAAQALQCHGGNGFIEENPMARVYREAPLNSVWEGTGNMMGMDVRRALTRDASCVDAFLAEVQSVRGEHRLFDAFLDDLAPAIHALRADEYLARPVTEAMARALQGAELLRHSTPEVVGAFMATRLGRHSGGWGTLFGSMGSAVPLAQAARIVARAQVQA